MLSGILIFLLILIIAAALWLAWTQLNIMLWITATSSNVPVSLLSLIGMRIRNTPSDLIINNLIRAHKAGIKVTTSSLENHFQAKGDITKVLSALITAKNAGIILDFESVRQLDLSGRDVAKVVGAVITAQSGNLEITLGNASRIDLSGRDVEKIVKAVVAAQSAGINLSLATATQIDLSGRDIGKVVGSVIMARNANINLDIDKAIQIDLSGRDLPKVINALIAAENAGLDLDMETAIQIDLAGRDIADAVKTAIQTKIIPAENPHKTTAIPKDGVEVHFYTSITAKTNITELLSGAGSDETLLTRVEQKLVAKISQLDTYNEVIQDPTEISNILEPEDGRRRLESAKKKLESAEINREKQLQKEQQIANLKEEHKSKHEEEKLKKIEVEDIKKQETDLYKKKEEGASKGLAEDDLEIYDTEIRRKEIERGKMESEMRRMQEEMHRNLDIQRRLSDESKEIEEKTFKDLDDAYREADGAFKELSVSSGLLLSAQVELEESYRELNAAYMQLYKHEDFSVHKKEALVKALETANREMENARGQLDRCNEVLRVGRDLIKVVNNKMHDLHKKLNEGYVEFVLPELYTILKKLEDTRDYITKGRRMLEDIHKECDDTLKVLTPIIKKMEVGKNAMEIARKKLGNVRRELNPARKELEENTIYHIISVEITNIVMGRDVGADLQKQQLETDEIRKKQEIMVKNANLSFREKEALIRELEVKHKLMEAEAKVNEALADAFKAGNLGALDFYRLKNLQADTKMRDSLGNEGQPPHS